MKVVTSGIDYIDPTVKALDMAVRAINAVDSVYHGDNSQTNDLNTIRYLDSNLNATIVGIDVNITNIPDFDDNDTAFH